ncbi:MAG: hypothetical protein QXJ28_02245 [Candidatus Pacearchaeota archaeon]
MKKYIDILILSLLIIISNSLIVSSLSNESRFLANCKRECVSDFNSRNDVCYENYEVCKSSCFNRQCIRQCLNESNSCHKNSKNMLVICEKDCISKLKPSCLNGTIAFGEKFTDGCNVCTCGERGRIICKKEPFCNKDVSVEKSECERSGGFYYRLCNGVYFDIVCSSKSYCICGGNFNYTCPKDYSCIKDFISPNKRTASLNGWKTLIGVELGDIGICGK